MIVKLQLSIASADHTPKTPKSKRYQQRALIYNKDQSIRFECLATKELVKLANGQLKCFVHAKMEGTEIVLGKIAPWQDW